MAMRRIGIWAILLAGTLAAGASPAQESAFDSVTVKVADPAKQPTPDERTSGGPGTSDPGHFYFANAGMGELIMRAYGLKSDQLSGPCWILGVKWCVEESVNFDVSATMPANTTEERFEAMLRNLLAARFHLAVHHQTRAVPGYELVAQQGRVSPEHPVAPPGDQYGTGNTQVADLVISMSGNGERAKFQDRSMADFVAVLESMVGLALGMDEEKAGRPQVMDKTGLNGKYSFAFGFACPCVETLGYQFSGGLANDPVDVGLT